MRFQNHIARFPPILCRILARHRYGPPLTTEELSKATGWTPAKVEAISQSASWHGIDVFELLAFTSACGVQFDSRPKMKRIKTYITGRRVNGKPAPPAYAYLKRSPLWASYYRPMIQKFQDSIRESIK